MARRELDRPGVCGARLREAQPRPPEVAERDQDVHRGGARPRAPPRTRPPPPCPGPGPRRTARGAGGRAPNPGPSPGAARTRPPRAPRRRFPGSRGRRGCGGRGAGPRESLRTRCRGGPSPPRSGPGRSGPARRRVGPSAVRRRGPWPARSPRDGRHGRTRGSRAAGWHRARRRAGSAGGGTRRGDCMLRLRVLGVRPSLADTVRRRQARPPEPPETGPLRHGRRRALRKSDVDIGIMDVVNSCNQGLQVLTLLDVFDAAHGRAGDCIAIRSGFRAESGSAPRATGFPVPCRKRSA